MAARLYHTLESHNVFQGKPECPVICCMNLRLFVQEALHIVSVDIFVKVATPAIVMKYAPTERMKRVKLAFEELEVACIAVAATLD